MRCFAVTANKQRECVDAIGCAGNAVERCKTAERDFPAVGNQFFNVLHVCTLRALSDRVPAVRQQLADFACALHRQASHHVALVGIRVMPVHAR